MRYVYFKRLKIVNFLSVGKKPVEINFKTGLNIITGRNLDKSDRANGVGKSTMADALHFALYGNSLRDVKKENIVNVQFSNDLCEVELDFDIISNEVTTHYKVVRTLNPTKCYFFVNGEDKTRSGVPQTTELIVETIHTSPEVFQNSIVMSVNNTVPFMAQKKVEKRKFIEGILGLEVFSNMLLQARSDFNDTKKELDIVTARHEEVNRSLTDNKKQQSLYEENKNKRLEVLKTRQTNNEIELSNLKAKVTSTETSSNDNLTKFESNIILLKESLNTNYQELLNVSKEHTILETQIKSKQEQVKRLKKVEQNCPHCGKDIAESLNRKNEEEKKVIEAEIEADSVKLPFLKASVQELTEKKKKIEGGISVFEQKINSVKAQIREVENIKNKTNQLQIWQNQLKSDIEQLVEEKSNFDTIIAELELKIGTITNDIGGFQNKIEIIETAKYITSEEGVKSYIVKKILEVLNIRLAVYLKKLESNCIVKFNEFFEETVTTERGIECSYFNFSGAERKSIDLAMLFTFQDIRRAQADVWHNLSMFDELLDSSLDEKGLDLVLDILRDRVDKYDEAVYIISHRKESMKYCTKGEVIFLEKKNGITTRLTNYANI